MSRRHTGREELDVRKNIPWVLSAASVSQHCRSRPSAAGDHRHKQLPRHSSLHVRVWTPCKSPSHHDGGWMGGWPRAVNRAWAEGRPGQGEPVEGPASGRLRDPDYFEKSWGPEIKPGGR